MNSWAELGLGELDDFNYGVNKGWVQLKEAPGFTRTFETEHFIVHMFAIRSRGDKYGGSTTINFDVDEVLPDMLAAQDYVKEKGYPSRSKDKDTYKVWSRALTAQGRRFKSIIAQAKGESPELAQLLGDWGGCAFAHGEKRPMPVIRGLTLRAPIVTVDGQLFLVRVVGGMIKKRDSYTEERAQEWMSHER